MDPFYEPMELFILSIHFVFQLIQEGLFIASSYQISFHLLEIIFTQVNKSF